MRERKIRGRMVILTSLHAESPRNLPHYSASKAGMTMVMKELARALGPDGIRVNAIAPGAIPGGGFDAAASGLERLARLHRHEPARHARGHRRHGARARLRPVLGLRHRHHGRWSTAGSRSTTGFRRAAG